MKKKTATKLLTATKLRIILASCLILAFVAASAGFVYMRGQITTFASEVNQKTAEAEASRSRVQDLKATEIKLAEYQTARERAEHIVAETKSYKYQNQIVEDLTSYGSKAGIDIMGFNFDSAEKSSTSPQAPTAAPNTPSTAPSAGLKSTQVTVNLANKISYRRLLKFLNLVEQNLTKMQIANINLSRADDDAGPDAVNIQSLNIEVYTR